MAGFALAAMVVLPLSEILGRQFFDIGIPGSGTFVQHLTLWVGFLGAGLAAREGKLLSLGTLNFFAEGRWRRGAEIFSASVSSGVSALLAWGAFDLVRVDHAAGDRIALGVPVWVGELVLPVAFGIIAVRLAWRAPGGWTGRAIAALGVAAGLLLGMRGGWVEGTPAWPWVGLVLAATALGAPIFVALGGLAVLLFLRGGVPASAVIAETYRLSVSPALAAIPLFTLTGFALAEGRASERLLRLFHGFFGWVPGSTAVVCTAICAFFTAFTGGSGVTILALGGLLFPALLRDRYPERFSLGLLTSAGALGLLFPPALPLILYGVVAQVPIEDLFLGGVLPGILMVGLTAAWGIRAGVAHGTAKSRFSLREASAAFWAAKWEAALPLLILVAIFSGYTTLVEASALTALYAILVQILVHRDLSPVRDLPRVLERCAVLFGGVLVILGVAMGLTNWMVDAEVPARLLEWTKQSIDSPLLFLFLLNVLLIIVGCLMDIFAATIVVVPLITPLGAAFGIDPVHLGIIFVANLELGFLTPPVGVNLFLASYRFERPLLEVYRATMPFLLIRGAGVLLVTYLPWMTTALPRWEG